MSLTPDEIVNFPLKQAVRGYSVKQVDELLDQVADTLERAQNEAADLRERLMRSEQQLASVSETEATLKRTLVTAQRAAEQSLEEARTQASELVEQAKLEAEELRTESVEAARVEEDELRRRRQELERRIAELREFERDCRERLRTLLEEQLRQLDELPSPPPAPAPRDEGAGDATEEMSDSTSNFAADAGGTERPLTVRIRPDAQEPSGSPDESSEDHLFGATDTGGTGSGEGSADPRWPGGADD